MNAYYVLVQYCMNYLLVLLTNTSHMCIVWFDSFSSSVELFAHAFGITLRKLAHAIYRDF